MTRVFSDRLRLGARAAVLEAIAVNGTVDITELAEKVRLANIAENVAREDVELMVMQQAQSLGAPMAFSAGMTETSFRIAGK